MQNNITTQRRQAARKLVSVRDLWHRKHGRKPGTASSLIRYFPDMLKAGSVDAVVLYARCSGRVQNSRNNALDALAKLRLQVPSHIPIVGEVVEVGPGYVRNGPLARWQFHRACWIARQHDAVVLAECTNRLVRHVKWRSTAPDEHPPTDVDLANLSKLAEGVALATAAHPDLPERKQRQMQSQRGQSAKSRTGGRGNALTHRQQRIEYSRRLRERKAHRNAQFVRMHAAGYSISKIAKALHVSRRTAYNLRKTLCNFCAQR